MSDAVKIVVDNLKKDRGVLYTTFYLDIVADEKFIKLMEKRLSHRLDHGLPPTARLE